MSAAPESEAMEAVEPLVAMLAVATVVVMAALIAAALLGRGPLLRRFLDADQRRARPRASPVAGVAISPSVRFLTSDHRQGGRSEALARRGLRPSDEELDDILHGALAAETFDRAVRVLAWSSILIVLVGVAISQLWQPVEPQILVTLTLAGIVVLGVHELVPPGNLGALRIVLEGSAFIVFLTMLVRLTGGAPSPFFFIYPLIVGAAALVASPRVTLLLAAETAVAYAVAAFSGPLQGAAARDALVRVAINMTALVLLSYAGMVISRIQRRTREAAIRLSAVDSLTDLYNRAYFFTAVDREIQRSRRFKRGFCLLMMDLDGLKSINDRYGHYHGDLILRGVAHIIRAGLRGVDIAARYGGDEFVALLPETDPSGAFVVAEKIRQLATEMIVDVGGQKIRTSLSIGLVSYPDDGLTSDELMIAADQAMYSSKRLGKNRVVGYADSVDPTAQYLAQPYQTPVSTPGFRLFARDTRPFDDRGERRGWEGSDRDPGERGQRNAF